MTGNSHLSEERARVPRAASVAGLLRALNWGPGWVALGMVFICHMVLAVRAGTVQPVAFLWAFGSTVLAVWVARSALATRPRRLPKALLCGSFALFGAALLATYAARLLGASDTGVPLTRPQVGPALLFVVGLFAALQAWTILLWVGVLCDARTLGWRLRDKLLGWGAYAFFVSLWVLAVTPLFQAWQSGVKILGMMNSLGAP